MEMFINQELFDNPHLTLATVKAVLWRIFGLALTNCTTNLLYIGVFFTQFLLTSTFFWLTFYIMKRFFMDKPFKGLHGYLYTL